MGELDTLIEKLVDISGGDFKMITGTSEITGLMLTTIVANETTVFAKITTKSGANALTGKLLTAISVNQGMVLPFYKDPVVTIQLTSGSVIGYYK